MANVSLSSGDMDRASSSFNCPSCSLRGLVRRAGGSWVVGFWKATWIFYTFSAERKRLLWMSFKRDGRWHIRPRNPLDSIVETRYLQGAFGRPATSWTSATRGTIWSGDGRRHCSTRGTPRRRCAIILRPRSAPEAVLILVGAASPPTPLRRVRRLTSGELFVRTISIYMSVPMLLMCGSRWIIEIREAIKERRRRVTCINLIKQGCQNSQQTPRFTGHRAATSVHIHTKGPPRSFCLRSCHRARKL